VKSPRRWSFVLGPLVVVAAVACAATDASAQRGYKADEVNKQLGSRGALVRKFMTSGDGDRQEFEAYFKTYYFPAMTQPSSEGLADLGKMAGDLFKNYLHAGRGDTQKWLSDQALAWGRRVAADSGYHPAVRLNAVLVVGRIDDVYDKNAPVPSAAANDFLCAIAAAGATKPRTPNYLFTAALTGLERHTRFFAKLPAEQKSNTARTLYGVLNVKELAGDYADGVRDWVFLQAAQAVANLGTVGPRGVFAAAIGKRVADESLRLDTRAELAGMLAELKGEPGSFPAGPVVKAVVGLAAEVARREAQIAEQFEETQIGGGRAVVASAGRDSTKRRLKVNENRETQLVREPLVKVLSDLRDGVQAVAALTGEKGRAMLQPLADAIDPALEAAADTDAIDLAVADRVKRMAGQVQAIAAPLLAEPEPAAEDVAAAAE